MDIHSFVISLATLWLGRQRQEAQQNVSKAERLPSGTPSG